MGINVDTLQNGGTKAESVMPGIRRFLLDHNVRWPNLVNGEGPHDYAAAYGVTEIPTNVLIGRDGLVIHVDLSHKNLAKSSPRRWGVSSRLSRQSLALGPPGRNGTVEGRESQEAAVRLYCLLPNAA